jgi:hypothetical protein
VIRVDYPHFDNASIAEFINFLATVCGGSVERLNINGSSAVTEINFPWFTKLKALDLNAHVNLQTFSIGTMPELRRLDLQVCGAATVLNGHSTFFNRSNCPWMYQHEEDSVKIGTLRFNATEIFANCPRMVQQIFLGGAAVDPVCFAEAHNQHSARSRSLPPVRHRGP